MKRSRWLWGPLAALVASVCVGNIGDDDASNEAARTASATFECDPTQVPDTLPLRRLSQQQYRNTIRDLMRFALPAQSDVAFAEVAPDLAQLVADTRVGDDAHYAGLSRLDQAVQQGHVDAAYQVAAGVGRTLTSDEARLAEVVGSCATDADPSNDDDCLDELIRRFGERALRRPIGDEDVAFYAVPAGAAPHGPEDYADVMALLLNSPYTLYFVEHGQGEAVNAPLTAYELASRLSYHFWQTLPDDELFEAARSGALLTEEGYRAQLDRVYADPRTREALATFFGEWLQNTTLAALDARVGVPVYDAIRGDFEPPPGLREAMWDEVVDSALYHSFDGSSSFEDFVRSDRSFARDEALASIYEVPVWDGQGEPPQMTQPERAGLLTRAALVATGSIQTRPIMKGVFLRKALLCDSILPPPPDAPTSVELEPGMSTRETVAAMTETGGCASCHATQINGLGYPTESFDPLGRVRHEQPLFDFDTGEPRGTATVDTTAIPRVDVADDAPVADAHGLTDRILATPKPYACMARQYFRFTFGRFEDDGRDGCALASVETALTTGRPLGDVLRDVALAPSFRHRTFLEEN